MGLVCMCKNIMACTMKTSGTSVNVFSYITLKDVGVEVPTGKETRKYLCSKAGDDGKQQ